MASVDPVMSLGKILSGELSFSPLCMILGAGASISSGGETFAQMKKRLLTELSLQEFSSNEAAEAESSEGLEEFFEHLFKTVKSPQTRAKLLNGAFPKRLYPSDGYVCTALLCSIGAIKSIVTTNFDHYLESAIETLHLDNHVYYILNRPVFIGGGLF